MKTSALLCLASFLFTSLALAGQPTSFPEKEPLIDMVFPDNWKLKTKDGVIYAHPAEDPSYFISISPLDATSADLPAAAAEVKEGVEALFKNVQYQEPELTEVGPLSIMLINAKGDDEDGKANINLWMVAQKDIETVLLVKCISSPKAFKAHGQKGLEIIQTITAHSGGTETQNYSFPSEKNPEFSVDFPADWKMEPNDEGVYVESPDKLIAMNVLMIDAADVGVAMGSMKKKVGGAYSSIVWNQGGEPEINKDEALGLTATFENAVAMDADVKYSVNFVQYVRKGSEKFLLLFSQQPLKALEKHGEAMTEIIKSIKVKNP
jgi:hypothetical protein